MNAVEQFNFQSVNGSLGFLGICLSPFVCFDGSQFQQTNGFPNIGNIGEGSSVLKNVQNFDHFFYTVDLRRVLASCQWFYLPIQENLQAILSLDCRRTHFRNARIRICHVYPKMKLSHLISTSETNCPRRSACGWRSRG